jgi:beta-lactamase class A
MILSRNLALPSLCCVFLCAVSLPAQLPPEGNDSQLDLQLQSIASAHRGKVALYAHNLRTGQTAEVDADEPVKTASVIKMGILLDAAEQIRSGTASFDEKVVLTKDNQVPGSGILGQLTAPLTLPLRDVLHLMVVLSDNTATNVAIDRLGLAHINATLEAAGLKQTYLYKKVYKPATGPMPADQPKFGLGKTTAREMASIMERFAECRLSLGGSRADSSRPLPGDGAICGVILHSLREQQDRDSLPRYLESLDTSEKGSAIANKTGALDQVRNDVALIASVNGPIVIAGFTWDNADQRWTGDNEAEQTLAKLAQAIVTRWSPKGLDAGSFKWDDPLAPDQKR